ncbi:hypothetical protein Gpo141_00008981 [Globisporangium polare]
MTTRSPSEKLMIIPRNPQLKRHGSVNKLVRRASGIREASSKFAPRRNSVSITPVMTVLLRHSMFMGNRGPAHILVYVVVPISGLYCLFAAQKIHKLQQRAAVERAATSSKVQVASSIGSSQSSVDSLEATTSYCPPEQSQIHEQRQVFQPPQRDRWVPFLGFSTAPLYLHVSSSFTANPEHWHAFLYACGSFCLKVAMQEAAKKFQLCGRNPPALMIHLAMTVPTLAIDTQIRLVFLRLSARQSLLATSVVIVTCKVLFRLVKTFRLRNAITSRLAQCKSMDVIFQSRKRQKTLQPRDLDIARAEYTQSMTWKSFELTLPSRLSIGTSIEKLVVAAVVQAASGLLCDWVLSLIETIHEVPLHEAIFDDGRWLLAFLRSLLAVLAAVNVGVVALFSIRTC